MDTPVRPSPPSDEVSRLLAAWSAREPGAREAFVPIVYEELRRLAHRYMRGERRRHTLQTTALVNEAYMRLVDVERMEWQGREHFFAMAATLMRRILVDYARERARQKRGGRVEFTSFGDGCGAVRVDRRPGTRRSARPSRGHRPASRRASWSCVSLPV